MTFEKPCGPCSGHGYYGYNQKDTCTVCQGRGVITLQGVPDDYKVCVPCSGHGYYGYDNKDTCKVCNGLGVIPRSSNLQIAATMEPRKEDVMSKNRTAIFLVHGRNIAVRDQVDLYLSKELRLNVRVMATEAHSGRTLPEKFEEIARECSFAVFLLTADDVFTTAEGITIRRARQNVVLEIGYFWGALGRRGRVVFLVDPEMDLPSDIQGVGWIPITSDLGETKIRLRKELESAGLLRSTQ